MTGTAGCLSSTLLVMDGVSPFACQVIHRPRLGYVVNIVLTTQVVTYHFTRRTRPRLPFLRPCLPASKVVPTCGRHASAAGLIEILGWASGSCAMASSAKVPIFDIRHVAKRRVAGAYFNWQLPQIWSTGSKPVAILSLQYAMSNGGCQSSFSTLPGLKLIEKIGYLRRASYNRLCVLIVIEELVLSGTLV